ncbi:MAG TPA: hypothetical protein VGN16_12505 [Acidobacteriaceae bacterium]|jgi:hypothetical protein
MLALLPFLFAISLAASPAVSSPLESAFAPLHVYEGTWNVHAQHPFSGGSGPDTLVNHCHEDQAFYTCEQVVNGKPAALVIYTVSGEAGKFDVDNVLPNGHASSDTDLLIRGGQWTYITNDAPHHPTFRVENTFHGPDAIHFEMFSTPDGGKTWTKVNEGDDTRVRP